MKNSAALLSFVDLLGNKAVLLILMVVLIVFIVLLSVLGIVFIIALRRRRPVVKVVMAPLAQKTAAEAEAEAEAEEAEEAAEAAEAAEAVETNETAEGGEPAPAPAAPEPEPEEEEVDDESPTFVTEGTERVRYDRSFMAKICQLSNESKEWYSELKNELLSYDKIKDRMSWKRETFRIGRMTLARLVVRGKTLCLLTAVEPISYNGTKYTVEDVSDMANTADTPTLYRIKSARRLKYAKEMIAGMMKEVQTFKKPAFDPQDYFIPYDGDMSLIQRGLIKRVVSGSTRTFKVEEVDAAEALATAESESKAETSEE